MVVYIIHELQITNWTLPCYVLVVVNSWYTKLHPTVARHSYTQLLPARHGYTQLLPDRHGYTQLLPARRGYTQLLLAYIGMVTPNCSYN